MFGNWHRRLTRRSDRQRGLAASALEGVAAAGMFAVTENWLVPLAVTRLGASNLAVTILAALPVLAMAGLSLGARPLIRLFGGDRRASIACTLIQAACLVGFLVAVHAPPGTTWPVPLLIGLVTVMGAVGAFGSPAYQSMLAALIPRTVLGRYVTVRMQLSLVARVLLGAGLAGVMQLTGTTGPLGYDILLALAFGCRLLSAWLQTLIPDTREPPADPVAPATTVGGELLAFARSELGRGTLIWVVLFVGVGIAGPFFAVFMLASHPAGLDLAHQPVIYWILMQTSLVVRMLVLPMVGRLMDRLGGSTLLRIALWGIALIPLPWAFAGHWGWIIAAEIGSGVCWCLAENAMSMLLLSCSPDRGRRARFIGLHQSIVGLTQTGSNLAGGLLLDALPTYADSSYRAIFLLSAILRIPAALLGLALLPSLRLWTSTGRQLLWRALLASMPATDPVPGTDGVRHRS
jgi:MFS family permease